MKRLFKYFKPRYWELRRILSDIKEAKKLILSNKHNHLCLAFAEVDDRYFCGSETAKYIPEFNPVFWLAKESSTAWFGGQPAIESPESKPLIS